MAFFNYEVSVLGKLSIKGSSLDVGNVFWIYCLTARGLEPHMLQLIFVSTVFPDSYASGFVKQSHVITCMPWLSL